MSRSASLKTLTDGEKKKRGFISYSFLKAAFALLPVFPPFKKPTPLARYIYLCLSRAQG